MLCAQRVMRPLVSGTEGGAARAAFITDALWPTLTTIRIYFFPLPSDIGQVKWETPVISGYGQNAANPYQGIEAYVDPLYPRIQGKVGPIELVKTVVTERIAPLVGLNFTFVDTLENSDIRIVFGPQYGCSSLVGNTRFDTRNRTTATMEYGWLDIATVIHEFCHALGMIHEHQNPQGNPIQWNREAIYCHFRRTQGWSTAMIDSNILETYQKDQTNGSNYDPSSIMIYSFPREIECRLCDPTNNSSTATCTARKLLTTLNGMEIRPIYQLSPTDKRWLEIMYPKDGKRDPNLIVNLPKDVILGPIAPGGGPNPYLPIRLQGLTGAQVRAFLRKHQKRIVLGIVAIVVAYLLIEAIQRYRAGSV